MRRNAQNKKQNRSGCYALRGLRGLFGAITKGLDSYLGFELEIRPIKWPPQEVAQRIYGTISFLFRYGDVLKDGETLGASETEFFRISRVAATDEMPAKLVLTLEKN